MNNNEIDIKVFAGLFREVCSKCFGHPVEEPLTETESRLLYTKVFEETGLVVGWKSIKNYSVFVSGKGGREENPSAATLDTFARYVLGAPYTTEVERKKSEGHYPWWYKYREGRVGASTASTASAGSKGVKRWRRRWMLGGIFLGNALLILAVAFFFGGGEKEVFTDHFHSVEEDSLAARGWMVSSRDSMYWPKRGSVPGGLTLFTLEGDNWPDPVKAPVIRNLMMRKVSCNCWSMEVHLENFFPRENWQQAGILLMEDTGFASKSLRVSIAYNDFAGGFQLPGTVLIQAITSPGVAGGKPEEIAHFPLLNMDTLARHPLLRKGLEHSALRIEKEGNQFRVLYADGAMENSSFKEVVTHRFPMQVRYAGLFALRGFVDSAAAIPASFSFFSLRCETCGGH
ncbi:MAG: hypothetical protein JST68_28165 [Bacteroidetes bacterium]|nr:hypothetical protein [Bacteroidota bacterium]